jgi:hypothetical protein
MTSYIPAALRQLVTERAEERCEYCRFPQDSAFVSFEIDHIISEKHSGATTAENLALACVFCNSFKGTDLGSLDPETGRLTAFSILEPRPGIAIFVWIRMGASCRSHRKGV